jgi:hypothetical protein
MNMPAMQIAICIPLKEPVFSIFRAVQEKHSPWTTMKPSATSTSKTIVPAYHTTLQFLPEKTAIVRLSRGARINSGFNQKNAVIYVTVFNFFMPTLTQR